jgi:MinD superfamily P-loop ATPase
MNIAVASGKGGTGKTTVAVNLALAIPQRVQLLDCDVEEPNGHVFLKPRNPTDEVVGILTPQVDERKCTGCGECAALCQYSAIVMIKEKPLVFAELCHGCGGCTLVCPEKAIQETMRRTGVVRDGGCEPQATVQLIWGELDVGEAMAPPVIREVKKRQDEQGVNIIDAPPGTSCPVIAALTDADFVILVTEPTPFGLHDLKLAVETVREMSIDFGVVINRSDCGDDRAHEYCRREGIAVLAEIPDDLRIARAYAKGQPAVTAVPELRETFKALYRDVCARIAAQNTLERKNRHADL